MDRSCCDIVNVEATTLHLDIAPEEKQLDAPCFPGALPEEYNQRDDLDVIIPDSIARPLVYSAHLLMVTNIFSFLLKVLEPPHHCTSPSLPRARPG